MIMRPDEMPDRYALAALFLLPVLLWLVFRLGLEYGFAVAAEAEHRSRVLRRLMEREREAMRPTE